MEWFPVRVDEVLGDARVRGLPPWLRWAWLEVRAAAAAAECGGVPVVEGRERGRWRLADPVREVLASHGDAPHVPLGRLSRGLDRLVAVGLMVPWEGPPRGYAFADVERWQDRESRIAADRERAKASRDKRSNGAVRRRTASANVTGSDVRPLDREVQLRSSAVPLSRPTRADDARDPDPTPVRIRTAAHLQQPASDTDIRPAVREAIRAARNIGGDDGKRLLADTLADLHPLTTAEHDATSSQE